MCSNNSPLAFNWVKANWDVVVNYSQNRIGSDIVVSEDQGEVLAVMRGIFRRLMFAQTLLLQNSSSSNTMYVLQRFGFVECVIFESDAHVVVNVVNSMWK